MGNALAAAHIPPILLHDVASVKINTDTHRPVEEIGRVPPSVLMVGGETNEVIDASDIEQPPLHLDIPPADNYVSSRITVLVFTSPVPSHPSVEMILAVIESLRFVPGLAACRLIVTCDGAGRISEDVKAKRGHVTADIKAGYEESIVRLQRVLQARGRGNDMLILPEREGFGIAVRKALELVSTPYVMICQHDNMFTRPVDLAGVLRVVEANSDVLKCVHFVSPKTTFDDSNSKSPGLQSVEARLGRLGGGLLQCSEADGVDALNFWPMPSWLERNHICETAHYRNFVLGPDTRIKRGQFIEETFGQKMRADLAAGGDHRKYGVFRLLDNPASATMHVDGRTYLPVEECRKRGRREAAPFQRLEEEHRTWLAELKRP